MAKKLYFAYGSNMDEQELKGYIEKKEGNPALVSNPRWACLGNYKLVFNYYSPSRRAGAANIEPREGSRVEGVLWNIIDESVVHYIDLKEGHSKYYVRIFVQVKDHSGSIHSDVLTYQVIPEKRSNEHIPPKKSYVELMKRSAEKFGFSPEYRDSLDNIETKEDDCPARFPLFGLIRKMGDCTF